MICFVGQDEAVILTKERDREQLDKYNNLNYFEKLHLSTVEDATSA